MDSAQQMEPAQPVENKKCTRCGEVKELSLFSKNSKNRGGLMAQCKSCKAAYDRARRERLKGVLAIKAKERHLKRYKMWKYGITNEQWDDLFDKQERCCAICKTRDPNKGQWCTDHDHDSGKVRGILCHHCNRALGLFGDSASNLSTALDYLANPPYSDED